MLAAEETLAAHPLGGAACGPGGAGGHGKGSGGASQQRALEQHGRLLNTALLAPAAPGLLAERDARSMAVRCALGGAALAGKISRVFCKECSPGSWQETGKPCLQGCKAQTCVASQRSGKQLVFSKPLR